MKVIKRKVLIISNEGMEDASSNGRTMKMLLKEYDKDSIAQFFIHGRSDKSVCTEFFCISDKEIINVTLHPWRRSMISGEMKQMPSAEEKTNNRKYQRSCKNMALRDFIWTRYVWWTSSFTMWLKKVAPDIIIFQAGDCPFMFEIAEKMVRMLHVPLVIYNSESYLLRDSLFHGANTLSIWHKYLKKNLHKGFEKLLKHQPYCVFNMERLENDFRYKYPSIKKSKSIYMASTIEHYDYRPCARVFTASYCGTLGGGRVDILCRIANVLKTVTSTGKLIVCGRCENENDRRELCSRDNIIFKGFVSYDDVKSIIYGSDLILDCNGDERIVARFWEFSTKIADCLMCGIPFMTVASRKYPYVQYLEENNSAFVAESIEEMLSELTKINIDVSYRISHLKNAFALAKKNHDAVRNSRLFTDIIENA